MEGGEPREVSCAFRLFSLEATANMFLDIVLLCLQGDEAEMTEVRSGREKRDTATKIARHRTDTTKQR